MALTPAQKALVRTEKAVAMLVEEGKLPRSVGLPYVVYQLIDPRTGWPFYIGSGNRGRPYAHLRDAGAGKHGARLDRIREIWAAGHEPKIELLIECDSLWWARENEKVLVKSTPGLVNVQWHRDQPLVVFIDEFVAALQMPSEQRLKRYSRLLRLFNFTDCVKRPGHGKLWLEAFKYVAEAIYGKKEIRGQA